MASAHLKVFRGGPDEPSRFEEFDVPVEDGMVVLDALHWIQGNAAPDLAVRWNCKAAKCGSCSAEVDGRPSLTCKTRLSDFDLDQPITVEPMRAFPLIRDLVTDVSWNYAVNKTIEPFKRPRTSPRSSGAGSRRTSSGSRSSGSASSASCARSLPRAAQPRDEEPVHGPALPRPAAGLELHPIDTADRRPYLKDAGGIGYCNITKCCTEVCPEHIKITDNAIIPLKERVADAYYDPLQWAWRKLRGRDDGTGAGTELPVLPGRPAPATRQCPPSRRWPGRRLCSRRPRHTPRIPRRPRPGRRRSPRSRRTGPISRTRRDERLDLG